MNDTGDCWLAECTSIQLKPACNNQMRLLVVIELAGPAAAWLIMLVIAWLTWSQPSICWRVVMIMIVRDVYSKTV